MALTVNFWGFGKKENSTINPSILPTPQPPLKTYNNVLLKDNCSIVNPALKILEPMTTNVHAWNYCYIPAFSRYYYVTDWIWDTGVWICELRVDVLASFKTEIGAHTFYILRAYQDSIGNNLFDGDIVDTTYPVTADAPTYQHDSTSNPFQGYDLGSGGTYIVGIISEASSGVTYYAMNQTAYSNFCSLLFNYSTGWLGNGITEISADLQKALINPFQYVVSAIFMPMPIGWFSTQGYQQTTTVKFGWWSVTLTSSSAIAHVLPKNVLYQFTNSLTIKKHPLASTRGNYLNLSPYSTYTLRYYPFGVFDVDSLAISNYATLYVATDIDVCTGKSIMTLYVTSKAEPIRVAEGNVSIPIPTVSVNVDYVNAGSKTGIVSGAASLIQQATSGSSGSWFQNLRSNAKNFLNNIRLGNWSEIKQEATQTVNNIASAVFASKATAEINGMQGAFKLASTQSLCLSGRFANIADEDYAHRGRPLCQNRQISSMKGFIMCADADPSIPCTDREKSAIQSYLEGGFFYN